MNPRHLAFIAFWLTIALVRQNYAAELTSVPAVLRTTLEGPSLVIPMALSYQQVVLEKRSGNGWKPLAVQYPRTLSREQMRNITFSLPAGTKAEDVRVLGYRAAKFPSRFVYGKRVFSRPDAVLPSRISAGLDRLKSKSLQDANLVKGVKEANLWQVVDNQLFVYNQYRGLQVLSLKDPTQPVRLGALRLPALGRQMFALDTTGTQWALLGRSNGRNRSGSFSLFLLRVEAGQPSLVSELPLEGEVTEGLWNGKYLSFLSTVLDLKQGRRTQMIQVDVANPMAVKIVQRLHFTGTHPAFREQAGHLMVKVKEAGQDRLHEVVMEGGAEALKARAALATPFRLSSYAISVVGANLRVRNFDKDSAPVMEIPLAWRADRVLPLGDFLIQVEDGDLNDVGSMDPAQAGKSARVRITTANDPDALVGEWQLGPGMVAGMTLKGDHLLIAQWVPASLTKQPLLRTWALDLSDPSSVARLGVVEQDLSGLDAWDLDLGAVQPLWIDEDTLVWYLPAQHHPRLWWSAPMPVQPAQPDAAAIIPATSPVMVLCRIHFEDGVLEASEPQVLRVRGRVVATSAAHVRAGFLWFSYDVSDEVSGTAMNDGARVPLRPLPNQIHTWLQVMDLRAGSPLLREVVSIPGPLLGVTQADAQGAVIFTHSDMSLRRDLAPTRVVQACAYDGVNAYLLDDYVTATSFQSALALEGTHLYLAKETGRVGVVAVGYDAATGRLGQVSSWNTQSYPTRLHVTSGHLLASSPGNLEVATLTSETGKLKPIASYDTPVNLTLPVGRAAVTPALDLWIPAGMFGVEFLQKQSLGRDAEEVAR
ncbi:hypothetical protein [Prosthecobacter dejongeii]|uniref:Uncharacterized protein n=1 Tax=Prosthecobacter dejongeii TaxID=48465 RepID=A0A7W8DQ12_9BACT|nr:hypothetical protein [Prosthecobacter dejongeii]MBB5037877.1 hypothetical protein [Prosthecobacter dejongeii]